MHAHKNEITKHNNEIALIDVKCNYSRRAISRIGVCYVKIFARPKNEIEWWIAEITSSLA